MRWHGAGVTTPRFEWSVVGMGKNSNSTDASMDLPCWQDAFDTAERLETRVRDPWAVRTIAQLPFVSQAVLEQLAGIGPGGLGRAATRLIESGLVATIAPSLAAAHDPRLFYLTDLGIATLAVRESVRPVALANRMGITHRHLVHLFPA